jgi:hypothetical protein
MACAELRLACAQSGVKRWIPKMDRAHYKAATWKNAIYILCMMGNSYLVHTPRHNKVYMS